MNTIYIPSPIGILELSESGGFLCSVTLAPEAKDTLDNNGDNKILNLTAQQLAEYFEGKRKYFDIPLNPQGTDFQKSAWNRLLEIPYGETISYKEQAEALNRGKAYRAVGAANGKNPIPIIIPCHRVLNAGGRLGGYAYGLDVKKILLDLEQKNK